MDELARFADLKPTVPALAGLDRAALRRELFGEADAAQPGGTATLLRLDERGARRSGRRGRGVLAAAAAAAVAVAGGLGVVLVSGSTGDIVPSAPTNGAGPTTSAPPPTVLAVAEVPVPPRVLVDAAGWSVQSVYEILAAPRADRGAVLAPTGTFPLGPWVRVTARRSASPASSPVGTTPAFPDSSTVDVDGIDVTVSRMDQLTTATWSTADGASFVLDGWDVTTEEVRSVVAGIAFDGVTAAASAVPDGWEVVRPELAAALDHDTEFHFTDGTPSVPVTTLATAGDAPLPAGRLLTTRFYYGGERALRSRVAPGGSEVMTVGGEQLRIESDATYVRIHVIRGDWTWEVDVQDASGVTIDEALALFGQLREVDEATWTAALPAGTVTPAMRAAAVVELLVDLPVPVGYDAGPVAASQATVSRTSVAADVAVSVACAWLDEWAVGDETGDVARRQAATDALAGVSGWPILDEAQPGDGWDDLVFQMAAVVTDPEGVPSAAAAALDEQLTACERVGP